MRVIIDEATKKKARELHAAGVSKLEIARHLKISEGRLREVYDASYRDRTARRDKARRTNGSSSHYVAPIAIPDHVVDERDRAYSADVSIGAVIFGDPRPGRSALDRMNGGQHG